MMRRMWMVCREYLMSVDGYNLDNVLCGHNRGDKLHDNRTVSLDHSRCYLNPFNGVRNTAVPPFMLLTVFQLQLD